MDEDVEVALLLVPAGHDRADIVVAGDVARLDERAAETVGERTDPALDQALHRREADDGTLVMERLRDPPGNGMVVRDAEHERLAPVEQSHARLLLSIYPAHDAPPARPGPRASCSPAGSPRVAARPRRRAHPQGICRAGRRGGPRRARAARLSVPGRDQHLARVPGHARAVGEGRGVLDAGRPVPFGAERVGRARAPGVRRQARVRDLLRGRAIRAGGPARRQRRGSRRGSSVRGRGDPRRFARGADPGEPRSRVPLLPGRSGADRHAPQPVVADAGRSLARRGNLPGRPRVRPRAPGTDRRQAVSAFFRAATSRLWPRRH